MTNHEWYVNFCSSLTRVRWEDIFSEFIFNANELNLNDRIIDIVYNACNNELVRTKTIVKNAIVVIDAAPFRQWYEAHYALPLGHKKGTKLSEAEEALIDKKRSKKTEKKYKVEQALEDQFHTGRVLTPISCRADGYLLEGKELEFYHRNIKAKKGR